MATQILESIGFEVFPLAVTIDISQDGDPLEKIGHKPGRKVSKKNWNGHLVAIVDGDSLLDISLDQAETADLPPVLFKITPGFLEEKEDIAFMIGRTRISYHAHPEDKTFLDSHGWNNAPLMDFLEIFDNAL